MPTMNKYEFELRFLSYRGLKTRFRLDWDNDTLIALSQISNKGVLEKSVPETSPEDLKRFTHESYTQFKKDFIAKYTDFYPLPTSKYSLAEYIDRLEYELKVIKEMGFNSYFLIVSDYVRRAKKQMIVVGPGRGSGAGSLLARAIEITDIDPLPFDLLFERFLNPARISMPDFDIDFEDTQRQRVIDYCSQKYGQEKVCSIGTFMKIATKAAFKDSARAVGVPFERANQISNMIPDKVGLRSLINDPLPEFEEVQNIYNTEDNVKKAFDLACGIEGNLRQLGVHACGIIIAPEPVSTYTAAQYVKENDHTIVSQYDGPTLEQIWLLKMDFLWLRNLSIIKTCIKIIKARHEQENKTLDPIFEHFLETTSFQPDINDTFTYETVFKEWDTTWIFQFESQGMRKFLIQLEPNSINDLVAMNALYRPGPMEFIPRYIERKHGREEISYMSAELRAELTKKYGAEVAEEENRKLIEDLSPIMSLTYGIAVYQEQLMFLVQAMAGFSLGEADMLRRWVGKKKKEVIEKLKKEFVTRGETYKQYKPETTTNIYEKMIEPAASYSFNKSHSVCYAMIAYQTAYLKAHFPLEFSAALIRSVEEDTDTQSFYISEIQNKGISVLGPDVNESFNHVAAIWDVIRLWFFSTKGIGEDVWETIQQERQKGWKFTSLEDFLKRCASIINKKSLENLIKAGALDAFGDRNVLLENVQNLIDWTKNIATADFGLFGGLQVDTKIQMRSAQPSNLLERLMMEQETFKAFISGNPLDGLYQYIKKGSFLNQVLEKNDYPKFIIHGYIKEIQRAKKKWFFIKIEDISGDWEFFTRDALDFKKFDLVIIYGSKSNGRVYLDKIIKTDYEMLIKLAGSRYDPEWTVVRAKKERYGEEKSKQIEKIKSESVDSAIQEQKPSRHSHENDDERIEEEFSSEEMNPEEIFADNEAEEEENLEQLDQEDDATLEISDENNKDDEDQNSEPLWPTTPDQETFCISSLPDNLESIQLLADILKNQPGDIPVMIMGKERLVNDYGLQILREHFWK